MITAAILCLAPTVIDGDSIRCRNLGEVRLLAIDTADRTSSRPCRERYGDHVCDNAAAAAGKAALRRGLHGRVTVEPVTRDRYGRTVALVRAGGRDMSCHQLRAGVARYLVKYDNGRRVARLCPALAR